MAKKLSLFDLLRTDRDDKARAGMLDDVLAKLPEERQEEYFGHLDDLQRGCGIGEQGAKALLASLTVYMNLAPDQCDRWDQHGELVQRVYEWEEHERRNNGRK